MANAAEQRRELEQRVVHGMATHAEVAALARSMALPLVNQLISMVVQHGDGEVGTQHDVMKQMLPALAVAIVRSAGGAETPVTRAVHASLSSYLDMTDADRGEIPQRYIPEGLASARWSGTPGTEVAW